MVLGIAMFGSAAGVIAYDVYFALQFQKLMGSGEPEAAENVVLSRSIHEPIPAKLYG
jgi:Zn-dependent M28 family amino/carboxypeptidase